MAEGVVELERLRPADLDDAPDGGADRDLRHCRGDVVPAAAYDAAGVTNCSGTPAVCTPLWVSDTWTGSGRDAAPAIADGIVYRAVGSQLRAYDLHGQQGCSGTPVVCQKLWVAEVGPGVTAPAVANGVVYTGAVDGSVEAFDARGITDCSATTRVCGALWSTDVGSAAGNVVVSAGRVYAPAANGGVRVFGLPPAQTASS